MKSYSESELLQAGKVVVDRLKIVLGPQWNPNLYKASILKLSHPEVFKHLLPSGKVASNEDIDAVLEIIEKSYSSPRVVKKGLLKRAIPYYDVFAEFMPEEPRLISKTMDKTLKSPQLSTMLKIGGPLLAAGTLGYYWAKHATSQDPQS